MNNSETREKLMEEYEDSLMRLVMHDLAGHEGERYLEESKTLRESPGAGPSQEALDRFGRRLDTELKRQRAKARRPHLLKAINIVAVAMLAVIFVFFAAMTTVQAFRAKVMNLWLDIRPEYTAFKLKGNGDAAEGSMVVNWTNAYVPTYIPEGYEVSSMSYSVGNKTLVFVNDVEEKHIIYRELDESNNPVVDTENASRFEAIRISGRNGTLIEKNGMVTVVWDMDGVLFMVHAQTSVEAAVKIAEGVRYIK